MANGMNLICGCLVSRQSEVGYLDLSYAASGFCGGTGFCRSVLTKPGARFAQMLGTTKMLPDQPPSRADGPRHQNLKIPLFLQGIVLQIVQLLLRILLFGF